MTDIELRDSIAKELFVKVIMELTKTKPCFKDDFLLIAESSFIAANCFIEAKRESDNLQFPEIDKS